MKRIPVFIVILFALYIQPAIAQTWNPQDIGLKGNAGRYEDIFFINDSTAWTCNAVGEIYKTIDGGKSWHLQLDTSVYFRSIEFADTLFGYAGSLDSALYQTKDGGKTWVDISSRMHPRQRGICGISIVNRQISYISGVYSGPAYVAKTVDAGETWSTIDMSNYASALVDIDFWTADSGFVVGQCKNPQEGGVVLFTHNGGASWDILHKTGWPNDWIWKIQRLDNHVYMSVETGIETSDRLFVHSSDRGVNWESVKINIPEKGIIQGIGFLTPQKGWLGGYFPGLYETNDGGQNWTFIDSGSFYNRFIRLNDHTMYVSGKTVMKYSNDQPTGLSESISVIKHEFITKIQPVPCPKGKSMELVLDVPVRTYLQLHIYDSKGQIVKTLFDGYHNSGKKGYLIDSFDMETGIYYVGVVAREGYECKKIIIQ